MEISMPAEIQLRSIEATSKINLKVQTEKCCQLKTEKAEYTVWNFSVNQ